MITDIPRIMSRIVFHISLLLICLTLAFGPWCAAESLHDPCHNPAITTEQQGIDW